MNTIDIILALILVYGLVRGFLRGLLAEIASLVGIVAGIYGAVHFSHLTAQFLAEQFNWRPDYVNLLSFAITFVLIVFLISLAGKVLTKVAGFAALGLVNKFLGAAFGIIKVAFLTSVLIMFFKSVNETADIIEDETLEQSILYEPVEVIAPIFIPSILEEARESELLEDQDTL